MHEHVLDADGRSVLYQIGRSRWARGYYLAGGTGLALHLGHRRSFDLDLFTSEPKERLPGSALLAGVTRTFGQGRVWVILREAGQLDLRIGGVLVTFVAYPFPLTHPVALYEGLALADPREIALMKAYAVGRRATARDYLDLYWVLHSGLMSLADIIAGCREKFVLDGAAQFNARLFLGQLSYTADIEGKDAVPQWVGERGPTFSEAEAYLREEVRRYVGPELR